VLDREDRAMLIIAGWAEVDASKRDHYVADVRPPFG
jgi:hypothetical protein